MGQALNERSFRFHMNMLSSLGVHLPFADECRSLWLLSQSFSQLALGHVPQVLDVISASLVEL